MKTIEFTYINSKGDTETIITSTYSYWTARELVAKKGRIIKEELINTTNDTEKTN